MREPDDLQNIVTVKNIDKEDFIFRVNNVPYMIRAGKTQHFPKYIARLAVKHLIDKILIRKDKKGKFLTDINAREEVAMKVVINEEIYERPAAPTEEELVEDLNRESDIDGVLAKLKSREKGRAPKLADLPPIEDDDEEEDEPEERPAPKKRATRKRQPAKRKTAAKKPVTKKKVPAKSKAKRDIPNREEILEFAKAELQLDIDDPKTKDAWEKMSDEELYDELQMEDFKA